MRAGFIGIIPQKTEFGGATKDRTRTNARVVVGGTAEKFLVIILLCLGTHHADTSPYIQQNPRFGTETIGFKEQFEVPIGSTRAVVEVIDASWEKCIWRRFKVFSVGYRPEVTRT
jgi:hypothetical protein